MKSPDNKFSSQEFIQFQLQVKVATIIHETETQVNLINLDHLLLIGSSMTICARNSLRWRL